MIESKHVEYTQGVNDAEYVIKRLVRKYGDGGMHPKAIMRIFGTDDIWSVMASYSMVSIIEKVKEYEDALFAVGDVVYTNCEGDDRIGVITKVVVENGYHVLWDDGDTGFYGRDGIEKISGCTCAVDSLFCVLKMHKPSRKENR